MKKFYEKFNICLLNQQNYNSQLHFSITKLFYVDKVFSHEPYVVEQESFSVQGDLDEYEQENSTEILHEISFTIFLFDSF